METGERGTVGVRRGNSDRGEHALGSSGVSARIGFAQREILFQAYGFFFFKIHIQLLSFTYFLGSFIKELDQSGYIDSLYKKR